MLKKIVVSVFEGFSVVATAIAVIVVVFFFGRLTTVDGKSMDPTLSSGDRLFVYSCIFDYEYKDIVVIVEPNDLKKPIVKRVIATQGQWVDINYEEGLVYVGDSKDNLQPLEENYTASLTNMRPAEDLHKYPVQVPNGHLFVMGDNRNDSTDSRSYRVDFVDENYVLGKAICRLMPFGDFDIYDGE